MAAEDSSLDIGELFKALATGSQPALDRIVLLHEKLLLKEIKQIIQHDAMIKEVWSDTIEALWEHRVDMATMNNPVGWMVVTARHKAINKIRDEKRRSTYPISVFMDLAGAQNIEQETEAKELAALIDKAVQKLSPREKEIYTLVIKNGLSRKEIAAQLNLSEHTVRNQLRNAMVSLRKHLARLMNTILI